MIKLNSLEEMMQEHCSRIYWGVDNIEENIMFIVKQLPKLEIVKSVECESRSLLSEYVGALIFLRSEAMELGEKFSWFIFDPMAERLKLEDQNAKDIMSVVANTLNEQVEKFHNFLKILEEKEGQGEINSGVIVLFFESGVNILREREEIINSLNFLFNNYKKYEYEIKSKNTKSN